MEKYSEAVKDAQEKLELAEKKATDVSVGLGGRGGRVAHGEGSWTWEGREKGPIYPSTRTEMFSLRDPGQGKLAQIIPGSGQIKTTYHFPQRT